MKKLANKNTLKEYTWDVLTVTLNAENEIERCINSVKKQKSVSLLHTVFDGGSSDKTCEILANCRHDNFEFCNGSDRGIYDALNQVISRTSNELVAILHSDDYFGSDLALKNIEQCFKKNPSVDIVFCKVNLREKKYGRVRRSSEVPNQRFLKNFFLLGGQLAHPGIFVRRKVYDRLKFQDDLKISADYLFQLKCFFELELQFCNNHEVIVNQQAGGTSQRNLKAFWVGKRELYKAWHEHLRKPVFQSFVIVCLNVIRKSFMYLKSRIFRHGERK